MVAYYSVCMRFALEEFRRLVSRLGEDEVKRLLNMDDKTFELMKEMV